MLVHKIFWIGIRFVKNSLTPNWRSSNSFSHNLSNVFEILMTERSNFVNQKNYLYMIGEELFNQLSKRDFSGSETDTYAQDLFTMRHHIFLSGGLEEFYALLLKAHHQGKRLSIKDEVAEIADEYIIDDIIIV